jgi:serine/threonine-protein kinase
MGLTVEAAAAVVLLAASWLASRGQPSRIALYALDGVTTLLLCGALSVLILAAPPMNLPLEWIGFLAILAFLFLHAAFVPAPAARTFLLHLVACLPLFLVAHGRAGRFDGTQSLEAWLRVYGLGVWMVVFAIVAAVVSYVLHGLRVRFRAAAQLGQYKLVSKLGEGGMGIVYEGHHAMLRRPTAVKMLPPERAGEQAIARFEREVRTTSRLTHPNTVAIYDFGRTPEGVFYYAMELLDGVDLAKAVEIGGPMPPGRVIQILRQCAGALAEAHELGLVHRDLKPQNILLCRRGGIPDVAKVVDFGLVKDLDAPGEDAALSRQGTILGTPLHMAPEAILDPSTIDGRADLYALGTIGWFLLVGRPPFEAPTVVAVCAKHLREQPARPSAQLGAPVPTDLETILMRLLEKEPSDRFDGAAALEKALSECADADSWSRADADGWWSRHRAAIERKQTPEKAPKRVLTVAVDRS